MTIIDRRSVFLLLSYLVLSCGGETSTPTAPTTPTTPAKVATSITVSPSTIAFTALGAPIQLTSTVKDQGGMVMTGQTVTWITSDETVVTVSSTGFVQAGGNGSAILTGSVGSATATVSVTVAQVAATIELSPTSKTFT